MNDSPTIGGCGQANEETDPPGEAAPVLLERWSTADEAFLRLALAEARLAADSGDVPVGAVIVDSAGQLVARGRNRRETHQDPTAHAEIDALRAAARARNDWHLNGCTMYVTMEPCPMCAGALINARIARLVYGCTDLKAGAIDTLFSIGRDPRLNHRFDVAGGVLATECADVLKSFFAERRKAGPRFTPPGSQP
jgi:tRNA(adenine34) deaminase